MRHVFQISLLLALAAGTAACGKAAPALVQAPVARAEAVVAPSQQLAAPRVTPTASIVSNNAGSIIANNAARVTAPEAPAGTQYVELEAPPPGTPSVAGDDPIAISSLSEEDNPPSYRVDERTPYGVVVVDRTAHTATLAWRTDQPTRAIVQYGRTWGFKKHGYTDSFLDEVAKTDHKITITGLRRFTSYTFKVTAVTALGLKFSDNQDRKFRTKFWSWR